MNKKILIATLTVLGITAASLTSAYADTTTATTTTTTTTTTPSVAQQAKTAITNNDYTTFEGLYKTKTGSDISQDSFNKLVQLDSLHNQEAQLMTDLKTAGVQPMGLYGRGMGEGKGMMANPQFLSNLTDAQKQILQQAAQLRKDGKPDEAKQLLDNSGIKLNFGHGRGMMQNAK